MKITRLKVRLAHETESNPSGQGLTLCRPEVADTQTPQNLSYRTGFVLLEISELRRSYAIFLSVLERQLSQVSKNHKIWKKSENLVHFRATSNFEIGKSADLSTYFPNMVNL